MEWGEPKNVSTFVDPQAEKYLIRLQNALEREIWARAGFADFS